MVNFKQKIAKEISEITKIPENQIVEYIEVPTDEKWEIFLFHVLNLQKN